MPHWSLLSIFHDELVMVCSVTAVYSGSIVIDGETSESGAAAIVEALEESNVQLNYSTESGLWFIFLCFPHLCEGDVLELPAMSESFAVRSTTTTTMTIASQVG
jgi:hypothetical protein